MAPNAATDKHSSCFDFFGFMQSPHMQQRPHLLSSSPSINGTIEFSNKLPAGQPQLKLIFLHNDLLPLRCCVFFDHSADVPKLQLSAVRPLERDLHAPALDEPNRSQRSYRTALTCLACACCMRIWHVTGSNKSSSSPGGSVLSQTPNPLVSPRSAFEVRFMKFLRSVSPCVHMEQDLRPVCRI